MNRHEVRDSLERFGAEAVKKISDLYASALQRSDAAKFDKWASTQNGSARLIAFHDAVSDADDTLEAVDRAIVDGDLAEACKLIALGRESLAERITELKDLL